MPLDFADFAHHYQGSGHGDEARTHFEAIADVLECIVRLYWRSEDQPNVLGITLDGDALRVRNALESWNALTTSFNRTAPPEEARKKES